MSVPQQLKNKIAAYAALLNVPEGLLPSYNQAPYEGMSYIEYIDGAYHLASTERGHDISRVIVKDEEAFLFLVFQEVTQSMAVIARLEQKIENQDRRRFEFPEQRRLMGLLNPAWVESLEIHHKAQLEAHPLDDYAAERGRYCQELRERDDIREKQTAILKELSRKPGVNYEDIRDLAWEMACEKYPYAKE